MAGVLSPSQMHHHALSTSVSTLQEKNIELLYATFTRFINPFTEDSGELFNLVTKAVMPDKVKEDLCRQREIGTKLLNDFVESRIKSGKTNLWTPMTKCQLQTWKSTGKKHWG